MNIAFPLLLSALLLFAAPAMAQGVAGDMRVLLAGMLVLVGMLVLGVWLLRRRRRWRGLHRRNARLAAANAELRLVAERAEGKARLLDGTMAALADGIMVLDADLRLAGWNTRFPDYAGVPHRALRIGMSMEEVLRLQAEAGEFGMVDPEAEAARRMAALREGPLMERWERERPDGSKLELRRAPLPGGGFVTLYTPVARRGIGPVEAAMAEAFEGEWRDRLPRLTAAAADGDAPGARQAAHALRGIAANAGWLALAGTLGAIEAAAEARDVMEMRLLTSLLPQDPPPSP